MCPDSTSIRAAFTEKLTTISEVDACACATCRYKTLMTQYQRKGAVGAILVTPIIFLLLILLGQGISEMLDGPRLPTTRCTYCGPSNDDFGKAYCAGQECVDLFIPEYKIPPKGSKPYLDRDGRFGCNQTSPQCHQEAIATVNREREECRAIARVCGGGGNYSCFFPDATATISNEYSFDISRGVVKTCDFFEFRRLADNTTRAASAPNTNPLPFSYAPLELAARPIAYSSDGGDTAQQSEIVRRSLGSGLPSQAISASIQATLSSLFTLAALPGIGCGQTTNNDTLISLDTVRKVPPATSVALAVDQLHIPHCDDGMLPRLWLRTAANLQTNLLTCDDSASPPTTALTSWPR
jgi:hypothetical protein